MKQTAIYLRLSSEDAEREGKKESNSITNQRQYIKNYLAQHRDICQGEVAEYCDDGYSGLTFQRPGVQALLDAAYQKKVGCIIVKDFSRFGRNYIETGTYIERIFPLLGVRFISINDGYDSKESVAGSMETGFMQLAYELYSRDVSRKVKLGKQMSARKGYFSGSCPPYGYQKSPENRHTLIPEHEAAAVVRRIFSLRLEGKTGAQIAAILNQEEIDPPSIYFMRKFHKGQKRSGEGTKAYWNRTGINRMLQNECYIGVLVRNKGCTPSVHQKRAPLPKEEQLSFLQAHEAIVSQECFQAVQDSFRRRDQKGRRYGRKQPGLLAKRLVCGGCKRYLTQKLDQGNGRLSYFCHMAGVTPGHTCFQGRIDEAELTDAIGICLDQLALIMAQEGRGKSDSRPGGLEKAQEKAWREREQERRNLKWKQIAIFEALQSGVWSKEQYHQEQERLRHEQAALKGRMEKTESQRALRKGKTAEGRNRRVLLWNAKAISIWIAYIVVYDRGRIEVHWNFQTRG